MSKDLTSVSCWSDRPEHSKSMQVHILYSSVWALSAYSLSCVAFRFVLDEFAVVDGVGTERFLSMGVEYVLSIVFVMGLAFGKIILSNARAVSSAGVGWWAYETLVLPQLMLVATLEFMPIDIVYSSVELRNGEMLFFAFLWLLIACEPQSLFGRFFSDTDWFKDRMQQSSHSKGGGGIFLRFPLKSTSDAWAAVVIYHLILGAGLLYAL